jgi:hypothetical protein
MVQAAPKKKVSDMFKPQCVKNMEKALERLEAVTDKTMSLVEVNGHNLKKAAVSPKTAH